MFGFGFDLSPSGKNKQYALGPELIVNGNFDSVLTPWADGSSPGGSAYVSGGRMYVDNVSGTARVAQTGFDVVPGAKYFLSFEAFGQPAAVYLDGSTLLVSNILGTVERTFVAPASMNGIHFRNFSSGTISQIDNVSLKRVIE